MACFWKLENSAGGSLSDRLRFCRHEHDPPRHDFCLYLQEMLVGELPRPIPERNEQYNLVVTLDIGNIMALIHSFMSFGMVFGPRWSVILLARGGSLATSDAPGKDIDILPVGFAL